MTCINLTTIQQKLSYFLKEGYCAQGSYQKEKLLIIIYSSAISNIIVESLKMKHTVELIMMGTWAHHLMNFYLLDTEAIYKSSFQLIEIDDGLMLLILQQAVHEQELIRKGKQ